MSTAFNELTFEERSEYKEHIRLTCRIVCSYSRLDAVEEALFGITSAAKYETTAHTWCRENTIYIFDEEGFCTTYLITEET